MSQVPYPAPVMPPPGPPRSSGGSTLLIIVGVLGSLAFIVLVLAILAVSGVRKYLSNAKAAEALNTVGQLQKLGAMAYEVESLGTPTHKLCGSASAPVPASLGDVRGKKYMSTPSEWEADATPGSPRGFACLKFSMDSPQYFQYGYAATKTRFTVTAHGDLDGDGVPSTFEGTGDVDPASDTVRSALIKQTDPEE